MVTGIGRKQSCHIRMQEQRRDMNSQRYEHVCKVGSVSRLCCMLVQQPCAETVVSCACRTVR